MVVQVAGITRNERRLRSEPLFAVVEDYLRRAVQYEPCSFKAFVTEAAMLAAVERRAGRSPVGLMLLDSRGRLLSSEQFAEHLGAYRDGGRQEVMIAVGPADGWSTKARDRADLLLSLGPMTLPHALAHAVLAEQIYRALTILAHHPYHCGH